MLNELSNDPIQTAIAKIERQHEEDKQGLLFIKLTSYHFFIGFHLDAYKFD